MDLAVVVAPTALARDRTLPVAPALVPLLPDGGLRRGRVVSCHGLAGPSLGVALVAEVVGAGAWLAAVDVSWLGVETVAELGVRLDRLVSVTSGDRQPGWAEVVAAALDGFEVVITQPPARTTAGMLRRVQTRVQAKGGVLVVLGNPIGSVDVILRTSAPVWDRVAHGNGHLHARRVQVEASGRRVPRARRAELWLPGPTGAVAAAEPAAWPVESPVGLRSAG